jgi:phosphoribosylanthranilate isomerase
MAPSRLFVKICGITRSRDALVAAEAGADAVGFVFWQKSPRAIDPKGARAIAARLPPSIVRVGVFVDARPSELSRIADEAELDVLQLHGSESPESLVSLPRRCWKAVGVGTDFVAADALRYEGRVAGILLDTRSETQRGGTGRAFDWSLAQEVRKRASFLVLAGGLDPENVAAAVRAVRPDGVDVSSGVESSPGRKDERRVRAFIEAARRAS